MDFNWKKLIGTVAPWIGTALAGPLAGQAIRVVTGALGLNEDAKDDEISAAVAGASPEQLAAIRAKDQDFAIQMQTLGFKQITDLEKIAADDRASARAREIAVKDKTPAILAYAVTALAFILEAVVLLHGYPTNIAGEVVGRILGTLDASAILVLSYYFGSSSGSRAKDDTITEMAKK